MNAMAREFLCIGGALIDRKYVLHGPVQQATSNPGSVAMSFGGVARNISDNLARLGNAVALAAAIGDDASGNALVAALVRSGVRTDLLIRMVDHATPEYAAILAHQSHELVLAVVAMDHAETRMEQEAGRIALSAGPDSIVFADANLSPRAIGAAIDAKKRKGFLLAVDAVSNPKAMRLPRDLTGIDLVFMNADEAAAWFGKPASPEALAKALVQHGAGAAIVTQGAAGAVLATSEGTRHQPAFTAKVADVTGAGDSLIAATLWRLGKGDRLPDALTYGVLAASLTTESLESVHPSLSAGFLEANLWRIGKA
jgi:pseudouridine kinase